jgi:hypothetical protein
MSMADRMARSGPRGSAPRGDDAGPSAPPPLPHTEPRRHVPARGEAKGPFTRAELQLMAAAGELASGTYVWAPGSPGWVHAGAVPALAPLFSQVPPPPAA